MASGLPKLRSDLDRRRQTTAKGATFVVKDPVNGEFFRLQAAEGFIAEQLDGQTPLEEIQRRVENTFHAKLELQTLLDFVKTLDRNGLLETEQTAQASQHKAQGRLAGNLLYARFKLIDPDRLLDRLIRWVRFCFTPAFLVLSAGLMLVAVGILVLQWSDFADESARLIRLSTLPLLIATVFVTITAHEFAHALTCKHFGGQVREMGFLLLYFQPAFYCNVSDAWLFPEKSKRLWVGLAGPYFELFLWALAVVIWRLTDTDTWVNQVALVVVVTSGVKTLFNFNPLIKLDGYYLLTDYLDIPNLRQKSFTYLGELLKRVGGLAHQWPDVSQRERQIYLSYGLTAWLFSISLLAYLGLIFGEFLIMEGERLAFLALAGLISFRFRDKLRSLFGRGKKSGASTRARPTPAFSKPLALKLAAASIVLLLLFAVQLELRVAGPINVLPYHNDDVRAEIDGIIEQIYVDEGQRVAKGDLIARLSDREIRAELQKTEAAIQQLRAKLDQLTVGPTQEEIQVARSAVVTAQDRVKFAQAKRERIEPLVKQQIISQNDFDTARELETTAENALAEANSKLQVLLKGTRPEELKAARADLERLVAQQRYLEWQLARIEVLSPATGVVTTPSRQLHAMVRQAVAKGGLIAKVHELETVTVEATISEKEIADVKIGQTVGIKTRAYPERVFYGKVTGIAPTTQGSPAASTDPAGGSMSSIGIPGGVDKAATAVRVTTEIDNGTDLLKPGMTGMAKIDCGQRSIIELITRRLSRTFRVEFWSWW